MHYRKSLLLFGPKGPTILSVLKIVCVLGISNLIGLGLYLSTLRFISASEATTLMTSQVALIYIISIFLLKQPVLTFKVWTERPGNGRQTSEHPDKYTDKHADRHPADYQNKNGSTGHVKADLSQIRPFQHDLHIDLTRYKKFHPKFRSPKFVSCGDEEQ